MMAAILMSACTQLGKGDRDTRNVDMTMRATADGCFMQVKGQTEADVTDDTISVKHPAGG